MLNQFIWGLQLELERSISLQYPKSIAQAVSLAETTELKVKASKRPTTKIGSSGARQKGPSISNRGKGFWRGGMGRGRGQGVEEWGILVGMVKAQVEEGEEEAPEPVLILWRVTGAGCMAIWPVTVPKPTASQREAV